MIMKKLLMLTAIITGFSFVANSGNCNDNSAKKPIFRVVYDNERNENSNNNNNNVNDIRRPTLERNENSNNNNNNVNNVRGSTFMITYYRREPIFIVTHYDDEHSNDDNNSNSYSESTNYSNQYQ